MDKVIEKANLLRDYLNSLPEIKEYLSLKRIVEDDSLLKELRNHIIDLETRFRNGEDVGSEMKEAKKEYDSNPIVVNYKQSSDTVLALLDEIKRTIE
ncbi:MAG: YlbF family regulator [Erysipelotrichaceae bacterium]|nr:YlbF family regulator [Erysipelotrichaceae bacterium]